MTIPPMREPTYFVLASLLDGPLHGYGIIKRAGELSGHRVRLATGTLYAALDRLSAEGYVRLVSEEIVNGRARRSYGLTDDGAAALSAEAEHLARAARVVTGKERRSPAGAAVRPAEAGVTALERRYRRLLRAYPGWYLADRGEEMLDTLLEAAGDARTSPGTPARQWPSRREARTLILGGLRVRSGQDQRLTTAANLRLTVLLAVIILLCNDMGQWVFNPVSWAEIGLAAPAVAAVALASTGRRLLTGVVALVAAGLWAFSSPYWIYWVTGPVIALVVIAVLAPGKSRMPPGWRWPVLALYLDLVVQSLLFSEVPSVVTATVMLVLFGLAIAWSVVDARPMLALIVLVGARGCVSAAGALLSILSGGWPWGDFLPMVMGPIAVVLVLSMVVFWRLRRQSVL